MALPANIRVQVGVPFPAQVNGAGGISVTKLNGVYTIQPNFAALALLPSSGVPDPTLKQVWIFDPISGVYNTMTIAAFGIAIGASGISGATANGVAYATGAATATSTAALTNGQIVIGQTGGPPLPKPLTAPLTLTAAGALNYTNPATGGVARNVGSKLGDIVSIIDFGADPTGVLDSTAGIQKACDTGAFVLAPAGTYLILGTVTITKPVTLFGAGASLGNANGVAATTFFTANDGAHTGNDFLRINSNGVTIQGIHFNGLGSRATASNLGRAVVIGTDEINVSDGAITTGTTDFVSASTTFTAADVGKYVYIVGAGAGGNPLFANIQSLGALHHVNLSVPASTTVAAATARWCNVYTGTTIRGCSAISHAIGIHFMNAQKWLVDDCYLNNLYAMQVECRVAPDGGDNRVKTTWFFADLTSGRCILWNSGGGLWISAGCKFLQAWRHIEQNWNLGTSGEFGLHDSSLEGYGAGGSCLFTCAATFNGYNIVGNRFGGGAAPAILFDNAASVPAQKVIIVGNNFDTNSATNIIDIGKVNIGAIDVNVINGTGANVGIKLESNAQFFTIGPSNAFASCGTNISDSGTSNIWHGVGTWTPTFVGSGAAGAPTYSIQSGSWERAGRTITARFTLAETATGGGTGAMQIGGLPFTSANVANENGSALITFMSGVTLDATFTNLAGVVAPNTNLALLYETGSGVAANGIPVAKFAAASQIEGVIIYRV